MMITLHVGHAGDCRRTIYIGHAADTPGCGGSAPQEQAPELLDVP